MIGPWKDKMGITPLEKVQLSKLSLKKKKKEAEHMETEFSHLCFRK